ncbi:MAG: VCBS repeat-containing protein [Bacteroidia bacterium]|nr:VCBS repeat-containing protein [Bacteroidia bacterium]
MLKQRFLIAGMKKALLILMIFTSYSLKSQVTFTDSISLIPGNFKSVIPVGVLDMNNDGFDDIIHFRDRYTFVLSYYNKGNDFDTINLGKMDSLNYGSYPWSICVGDYDNDGDNDILFGGGTASLLLTNSSENGNFISEYFPDTFLRRVLISLILIMMGYWIYLFAMMIVQIMYTKIAGIIFSKPIP